LEGAVHLTMGLASVELGIHPIGCNNPVKEFAVVGNISKTGIAGTVEALGVNIISLKRRCQLVAN